MKNIKNWILALTIVASAGGVLMSAFIPQTVFAADACSSDFLGFPAWYRGLTVDNGKGDKCSITDPNKLNTAKPGDNGLSNFIWIIVLNCIEIALVAVGYITAFYFLYGGFLFVASQGNPEGAAKARTTLINATIGLAISLAAVALVNFIIDKVFLKL